MLSVAFVDALFSLATALYLAVIFTAGFARKHAPFSKRWWLDVAGFFLLVFLSTWAGRIWLGIGQSAVGLALPFISAVLIALVFMATPTMSSRTALRSGKGVERAGDSGGVEATLFLVLMLILSVLIIFGYQGQRHVGAVPSDTTVASTVRPA